MTMRTFVLVLCAIHVATSFLTACATAELRDSSAPKATVYVNDVTSFAQTTYPGHFLPHFSKDNHMLWFNEHGEAETIMQTRNYYIWQPEYSYEFQRWFYYNAEGHESVWEVPHDLGWRRYDINLDEL